MALGRIVDELDDRFRLLTGGPRQALARQQTLRASVQWSYDLLDDAERTVLRRLSVFVGGFRAEAAEAVAGFGALAPPTSCPCSHGWSSVRSSSSTRSRTATGCWRRCGSTAGSGWRRKVRR